MNGERPVGRQTRRMNCEGLLTELGLIGTGRRGRRIHPIRLLLEPGNLCAEAIDLRGGARKFKALVEDNAVGERGPEGKGNLGSDRAAGAAASDAADTEL